MKNSRLVELSYEIIPIGDKTISTKIWNSIFPRLMSLNDVHSISAMPNGNGIDLTVGYNCQKESCIQINDLIEKKILDESYYVYFNGANYLMPN